MLHESFLPKKETRAIWILFKQTFSTRDILFRLKQKFLSGRIQWYFTRFSDEKDHLEGKVLDYKFLVKFKWQYSSINNKEKYSGAHFQRGNIVFFKLCAHFHAAYMQTMFTTLASHIFLFSSCMFNKTIESRTKFSQTKLKNLLRQKHFNHIFC